jgi:hypothetical protein
VTLAPPIRWLQPADPTAATETARFGAWSELPAIERASGELELTAASLAFVGGLTSRQSPGATLAPLRRERSLEAPRGLVRGITRVLVGGRRDGPDLAPAPPGRTRQPLKAATWGTSVDRVAEERDAVPNADVTTDETGAVDEAPTSAEHETLAAPAESVRPALELPRPPARVVQAVASAGPAAAHVTTPLTRVAEAAGILPPSGFVSPAPHASGRPSPPFPAAPAADEVAEAGPPPTALPAPTMGYASALTPDFRPRRVRGAFRPLPAPVVPESDPAPVAERASMTEPASAAAAPVPPAAPASAGVSADSGRAASTAAPHADAARPATSRSARSPRSLDSAPHGGRKTAPETPLPTAPIQAAAVATSSTGSELAAPPAETNEPPPVTVQQSAPTGPNRPPARAVVDASTPSTPSAAVRRPAQGASTSVVQRQAATSAARPAQPHGHGPSKPVVPAHVVDSSAPALDAPQTLTGSDARTPEPSAAAAEIRSDAQTPPVQPPAEGVSAPVVSARVVDSPAPALDAPQTRTGSDTCAMEPSAVAAEMRSQAPTPPAQRATKLPVPARVADSPPPAHETPPPRATSGTHHATESTAATTSDPQRQEALPPEQRPSKPVVPARTDSDPQHPPTELPAATTGAPERQAARPTAQRARRSVRPAPVVDSALAPDVPRRRTTTDTDAAAKATASGADLKRHAPPPTTQQQSKTIGHARVEARMSAPERTRREARATSEPTARTSAPANAAKLQWQAIPGTAHPQGHDAHKHDTATHAVHSPALASAVPAAPPAADLQRQAISPPHRHGGRKPLSPAQAPDAQATVIDAPPARAAGDTRTATTESAAPPREPRTVAAAQPHGHDAPTPDSRNFSPAAAATRPTASARTPGAAASDRRPGSRDVASPTAPVRRRLEPAADAGLATASAGTASRLGTATAGEGPPIADRRPGLDLHAALSAGRGSSGLVAQAASVQRWAEPGPGPQSHDARIAVAANAIVSALPARLPGLDVVRALSGPRPRAESAASLAFADRAPIASRSPEAPAPRAALQLAASPAGSDGAAAAAPSLGPAGLVALPTPPEQQATVQRVMTEVGPEDAAHGRLSEAPDDELEELAGRLYDHIRARFRAELLIDRERAGLLADRY